MFRQKQGNWQGGDAGSELIPRLVPRPDFSQPLHRLLFLLVEVAGLDDDQFLRVDVLAQRLGDLFGRQGLDALLQFGLGTQASARLQAFLQQGGELAVIATAELQFFK